MGAFLKGGRLFEGGLKIVSVVGHIPVEIFLLVNCFFDATHTNNRKYLNDKRSDGPVVERLPLNR